ncbi:MAG: Presenilin-like membrane protease [Methanophagales archaeon]|nr:Presenilin-like membrane protease [Methanophagales archaeon]
MEEESRGNVFAFAGMGLLLLLTHVFALLLAAPFETAGMKAFENPESVSNAVFFFALVLGFTAAILVILKFGGMKFVHLFMLFAVAATIYWVLSALIPIILNIFHVAFVPSLQIFPLIVALALTALLYFRPEWYIIDAVGLLVASGVASIFGISLKCSTCNCPTCHTRSLRRCLRLRHEAHGLARIKRCGDACPPTFRLASQTQVLSACCKRASRKSRKSGKSGESGAGKREGAAGVRRWRSIFHGSRRCDYSCDSRCLRIPLRILRFCHRFCRRHACGLRSPLHFRRQGKTPRRSPVPELRGDSRIPSRHLTLLLTFNLLAAPLLSSILTSEFLTHSHSV